jgi:drug/metabolite transporter (DMT)-like permease
MDRPVRPESTFSHIEKGGSCYYYALCTLEEWMIPLLLSTFISSAFVLIVRDAQYRGRNALTVGVINYVVAALIYGLFVVVWDGFHPSPATLLIGISGGVLYSVTYLFLYSLLRRRGVSIAMAFLRLAVLIPVVCSIVVWGEHPNALQVGGIILCLIALPLLGLDRTTGEKGIDRRTVWLIGLLFLLSGGCQLVVKVFFEESSLQDRGSFFFILFGTAALVAALAWMFDRDGSSSKDAFSGIPLGLCNVFSNWFMLAALKILPGMIVFPFSSTFGLLFGTVFAAFAWKERLSSVGKVGIVLAMVAIALLNV